MNQIVKADEQEPKDPRWQKEKTALLPEEGQQADGGEIDSSPGQGRKVLVVDDNPIALWVFEKKLRAKGFVVICAKDPSEGTRLARSERVDLIILDVNFWRSSDFESNSGVTWDGFTVMQWLRRFPELAQVPVIVVSADDAARCEKKALAAGAVAFYQKPVDPNQLIAAMLRALKKDTTKPN